jgi:hypothetical protein
MPSLKSLAIMAVVSATVYVGIEHFKARKG